jgi:hypothetical protein
LQANRLNLPEPETCAGAGRFQGQAHLSIDELPLDTFEEREAFVQRVCVDEFKTSWQTKNYAAVTLYRDGLHLIEEEYIARVGQGIYRERYLKPKLSTPVISLIFRKELDPLTCKYLVRDSMENWFNFRPLEVASYMLDTIYIFPMSVCWNN